jgi:hypothetical protein
MSFDAAIARFEPSAATIALLPPPVLIAEVHPAVV